MTTTLTLRRTLLSLFVVVAALLSLGAGHALAAQRPSVAHRTTAVHHRVVAYADGSLTVARHGMGKRPVARACVTPVVGANLLHKTPVAYADGLLTVACRHQHRRRILAHVA
jgi:hypothetical protein